MALLRLPTSGLRLLPVRPARLSAPGQDRPAWQGSPGRKRDLPERVAGLLGGVESAVASAGRDVRGMLAPREGLAMSPGADFGVWTWGSMERALYRQAMVL